MNRSFDNPLRWLAIPLVLCALLIIPVVWDGAQGWIFPDSLSYIDLASDAVRVSPTVLLKNAYWSPLYPAMLATALAALRPSLATEVTVFYFVHWLTFVFAAAGFGVFWWTFLQWLRGTGWVELREDDRLFRALAGFGYVLFFVAHLNRTLWYLTPDLLMEGTVLFAAALAIRLYRPGAGIRHSVWLGAAMGAGYLAKAPMFLLSLALLAILWLMPPPDRHGRRHSLVALAVFCLVAAPLVVSLSREKHRLTFGDAGKLNYAYHIGDLPKHSGWIGQNPKDGVPAHPPRTISDLVLLMEFRTPVSGTIPIWYDPSYWWEGVKVHFDLGRQLNGLLRPFRMVHSVQSILLALVAIAIALTLLSGRVRRAIRGSGIQAWILLVWPLMALTMYALVVFNYRYTVGFILLLCLGALTLVLRVLRPAAAIKLLLGGIALLAIASVVLLRPVVKGALHSGSPTEPLTRVEGQDNRASSIAVAQELARMGIRAGDEIAVLGTGLDGYYARMAGVRVVAQIWEDPDRIENLEASQVGQILSQLRQTGVKALLSRTKRGFVHDDGWVAVPRTDVFIRVL
ncbi:MAG: hypothetical protein ABI759_16815 [Candidatus Solibacter sp.]